MTNQHAPYQPNPINTDDVELDQSLLELTEILAEQVHERWAKGRMDDGWTYGPQRDDAGKKHPCLIPYSELPESEKEYDRATALTTLKLIRKLNYRIVRGEDEE